MDVKQFMIEFNKHKNQALVKRCFHEDENCNKIIKAHSIQNNKILSKISENGEVLMFSSEPDVDNFISTSLRPQGRKKATTFTGFCGYHDAIFTPIEESDYVIGNREQEFLYAYRACTKEHHSKLSSTFMMKNLQNLVINGQYNDFSSHFDKNKPSPEHIDFMSDMFESHLFGANDAVERGEKHIKWFNNWLDNSEFENIISEVIELDTEHHLAVTSTILVERDLVGNQINNLDDWTIPLAPLFLTVFPQNGKTYIILSYFTRNKRRYKFLSEQILSKSVDEQKNIISNIIISYAENTAFSPILWRQFNRETQRKIEEMFFDTINDFDKPLVWDKSLNLFI
ncbi:hypothetical protein [Bacillus sp. SKDU12]|uniref:hypothetical protein n=1 Tax=Bacillus sp. SKDU12 TaxID=1337053 RepID=UPI00138A1182|nr:hypothetical protein BTW01_03880 [Bacillus sp. SKDU12]